MTTNRLTYPYRRRGLDHDWFLHEPTHTRPSVVWPQGKRIALWITVPVEFFPLDAPAQPLRPLGGLMLGYPDLWNYSSRDYGARIGIYRIMRVLDELGLRATAAMNSAAVTQYPRLVDELVQRKWEILANGVDMGHVHHSGVAVEDERALIRNAQEALQRASGAPVKGWHSPGRSHSPNTLTLLAERGFEYVTDWANDDMPYTMTTKAGPLCAMPLTYEWSDRLLLVQHNLTVEDYVDQVLQAFARLTAESGQQRSGRILSLSVTPWILGYPHRIAALKRLLGRILDSGSVWHANGMEIVDAFRKQSLGAVQGGLR
jgi:peptidoglycan/xylan/chitin deacetylase (PgdA/CDA1 family)